MEAVRHVSGIHAVDELERSTRMDAVSNLFMIHHRRLVGLAWLLVDDPQTTDEDALAVPSQDVGSGEPG